MNKFMMTVTAVVLALATSALAHAETMPRSL
jgi:hypothetical protein